MSLQVRLLGKPALHSGDATASPRVRGHKAWGLFAYLVLNDQPPARQRLAALLFADADDPLRALRWNIAELRRALGPDTTIGGDPLRLLLPDRAQVDVVELQAGRWQPGDEVPGELLEGFYFEACPGFDAWLLVTRRRLAGLIEAALTNHAREALTAGRLDTAVSLAGRLVELNPLDETHQALLVRCLADRGDSQAANHQLQSALRLFRTELGVEPSSSLRDAAQRPTNSAPPGRAAISAKIDAGRAAIAAGAIDAAVHCLRSAVHDAEQAGQPHLLARALTSFGAALLRVGTSFPDAEATLRRGLAAAESAGDAHSAAVAHRELGFLHVQAGHRIEGDRHLLTATDLAAGDDSQLASIQAISGMSLSDQARYRDATDLLQESVRRAHRCERHRKAAWSLAMLGRAHLLCGETALAVAALDEARRICRLDRWSGFLPWPETLGAETELILGHPDDARLAFEHAHALAEHLDDTGLQAFAARGLALVAAHRGDAAAALDHIETARLHAFRGSNTYVWIQAQVAQTRSELLLVHEPDTAPDAIGEWIDLAARADLVESTVRAHLAAARAGQPGALDAAIAMAARVDNPALHSEIARRT
ncbi:MAG: BTAD domain-containing putative transcriptional regulator [Acidimicrobiales bacterium]